MLGNGLMILAFPARASYSQKTPHAIIASKSSLFPRWFIYRTAVLLCTSVTFMTWGLDSSFLIPSFEILARPCKEVYLTS